LDQILCVDVPPFQEVIVLPFNVVLGQQGLLGVLLSIPFADCAGSLLRKEATPIKTMLLEKQ
jgi:hypothetical protein